MARSTSTPYPTHLGSKAGRPAPTPAHDRKQRQPVLALYVLFAAAVLLETYYSPNDYIGQYLPFWEDLNTLLNIKGLPFSLAEIFIVLVLLFWLLKSAAAGSLNFDRGSLMRPVGFYMLLIAFGTVHGLMVGADYRFTLQEVRSQAYMFVAYIMTCNFIRQRSQVNTLLWILFIGSGLRAIEGSYRYLFTIRGIVNGINELYPHEQAFFWNASMTATAILFIYGGGTRRMKRIAVLFLPFVIFATIENNRRAAILALGISLPTMLILTFIAHPARRRVAGLILLALALIFPPYYAYFQNKSGSIAMPARAIASNFHPDPRDASSNQARKDEDTDIMATLKQSSTTQVIGTGFGVPMLQPISLADVTKIYPLEIYLPHNSILWVWMRLGTIGYASLWLMIGAVLVQAMRLLRRLKDPPLQGLALLVILMTVQQIIFGYLDQGWTNERTMIVIGVLFALLSRLSLFETASNAPSTPLPEPGPKKHSRRYIPPTLTVVDGRLKR